MRALPVLLLALAACQAAPESSVASADVREEMAATRAPAAPGAGVPVGRDLIRTADVTVRTPALDRAVAQARAATRRLGGTVSGEQSTRSDARAETRLTLRVPAARFDSLLGLVSALPGSLEARRVEATDVTHAVADVEARLRARRAAEARLLALLDAAEDVDDILAVQTRLDAVREEIETAEAAQRTLTADVAQSTITLTLYTESAVGLGAGFARRVSAAAASGWNGLLGGVLALVRLWPLLAALALTGWALRRRRRRREARRLAALPPLRTVPPPVARPVSPAPVTPRTGATAVAAPASPAATAPGMGPPPPNPAGPSPARPPQWSTLAPAPTHDPTPRPAPDAPPASPDPAASPRAASWS